MLYSELETPDVRYPRGCCNFVHGKIGGAIKGIVKVAKKAAPLATLAIPGVGPLGVLGSLGSRAFDFIKNNPELAAGGISAIQNARTQGKRDEIREELLANSRADRARRQGFLDQIDIGSLRDIEAPYWGRL